MQAHPRVGGENPQRRQERALVAGSSPRGRGKLSWAITAFFLQGLIPAWAGKTWSSASRRRTQRAHPRVGGENRTPPGLRRPRIGSSPRGRGKPDPE